MLNRKEYMKNWYAKNKERCRKYKRTWMLLHPEYKKGNSKRYSEKHKDRLREYQKEYRLNNKEKICLRSKAYYYANKIKCLASSRRWANSVKGRIVIKAKDARRRIQEKGLSTQTIQLIYEDNIKKFGTLTCIYCLNPIPFGEDTLEHKQPLFRGGTNLYENLGIACLGCNSSKQDKTETEFRENILVIGP